MKSVSHDHLVALIQRAEASPRKRLNLNIHPTLDDEFHRFFNVMLPGTYVRPHRHEGSKRWELFVILQGEALVNFFDNEGRLRERHVLNPNSGNVALEIPAGTWHNLAITQPQTILFECKPGPYQVTTDKDFAQWAPKEGEANTELFITWFIQGEVGSLPPKIN